MMLNKFLKKMSVDVEDAVGLFKYKAGSIYPGDPKRVEQVEKKIRAWYKSDQYDSVSCKNLIKYNLCGMEGVEDKQCRCAAVIGLREIHQPHFYAQTQLRRRGRRRVEIELEKESK